MYLFVRKYEKLKRPSFSGVYLPFSLDLKVLHSVRNKAVFISAFNYKINLQRKSSRIKRFIVELYCRLSLLIVKCFAPMDSLPLLLRENKYPCLEAEVPDVGRLQRVEEAGRGRLLV